MPKKICVCGAGLVGLTTALVLSEAYEVTIVADQLGMDTNSAWASAIWHVYLVDDKDPGTVRWSEITLRELLRLKNTCPESGVELTCGVELFRRKEKDLPTWSKIPPQFEMLSEAEISNFNEKAKKSSSSLPFKWGYRLQAPVALMKTYLPWLYNTTLANGVLIIQRQVKSLDECFEFGEIVVNCTGYRAKDLVADSGLIPVKGEYVSYPRDASCPSEYIGDDEHPEETTYMMPIGDEVLVGGSEEMGKDDLIETRSADQLLKRIEPLCPWATDRIGKEPTRRVTGYRPYRKQGVAFGRIATSAGTVINNFGHGGSGFSLAWGCAESVKELIDRG